MGSREHIMFCPVDKLGLADGETAPKQKDNTLPILVERLYGGIGKLLPTVMLVRACLVGPHG